MKVIGISGTPRKDGNTECLVRECLNEFTKQGWTVSEFFLSEKTVKPCIGCDSCVECGVCAITDDDCCQRSSSGALEHQEKRTDNRVFYGAIQTH